jgi:hypothetical protein
VSNAQKTKAEAYMKEESESLLSKKRGWFSPSKEMNAKDTLLKVMKRLQIIHTQLVD